MKEYILCAAISDPEQTDMAGNRLIFCGHRHANILWQGKHVSRNPYHQGFLTSAGRYVSRKEALAIAKENKQIIHNIELDGGVGLTSEDLY